MLHDGWSELEGVLREESELGGTLSREAEHASPCLGTPRSSHSQRSPHCHLRASGERRWVLSRQQSCGEGVKAAFITCILEPKVSVDVNTVVLRVMLIAGARAILALHPTAVPPVLLVPHVTVGVRHREQQQLPTAQKVQGAGPPVGCIPKQRADRVHHAPGWRLGREGEGGWIQLRRHSAHNGRRLACMYECRVQDCREFRLGGALTEACARAGGG